MDSNGGGVRDVGGGRSRCAVEDNLSSFKSERCVASSCRSGACIVGWIELTAAELKLVLYVASEED